MMQVYNNTCIGGISPQKQQPHSLGEHHEHHQQRAPPDDQEQHLQRDDPRRA